MKPQKIDHLLYRKGDKSKRFSWERRLVGGAPYVLYSLTHRDGDTLYGVSFKLYILSAEGSLLTGRQYIAAQLKEHRRKFTHARKAAASVTSQNNTVH